MTTKAKNKLPPLKLASNETFGERLARLRKEKGLSQIELAEQVGTVRAVLADYERDKVRLNAEMICRLAAALDVTTDEFLGVKRSVKADAHNGDKLPLKLVRRIKRIEQLPSLQQRVLLRTIDGFLRGEGVAE